MTLRTRLTARLGIAHPILLAPMGGVAGGRLAGAVSDAGGLGFIGGGYGDAAWLEREFAAAGNRRIGCGFITWSLAKTPTLLDTVLDRKPAAVMLSFGEPEPFARRIRDAGSVLICQVQDREQALRALDVGAEIVVAQGTEAGGHGGARATLPLVPAIVDLVARRAPAAIVVAAGGIADGRGLAAALALGAEGVLVGTRFYACAESLAHDLAKARVVAASGDATIRTTIFDIVRGLGWPKPYTGRALNNAFCGRWHGREEDLSGRVADEMKRYKTAVEAGDFSTAVIFAGEDVDLIDDTPPAAAIVARLTMDAERALRAAVRQIV